jgi:5-methylthioadenosine/S-adenosylhomocysteine deaminase
MHLSETKKEVDDCLAKHRVRPTEYLARRGVLAENIIFAHAVWLTEDELDLLAEAGSTVIHCPASNMKLVSAEVFPFRQFRNRNIPMMLGTDSHGSNNNIDMLEEMKVAALLQKHHFQDPTEAKAEEILAMAQGGYASFFPGLGSSLDPGEPADILLLNPDLPEMVPNYHLASTLVYSALQEAVDTVVCDGRVLMENRHIPEEQEILSRVRELVKKLGPGCG